MPNQEQRVILTDIYKSLDELVALSKEAEEFRQSIADMTIRLRVQPDSISDASCVALRQKLVRLVEKYEACVDEASSAAEDAIDLKS